MLFFLFFSMNDRRVNAKKAGGDQPSMESGEGFFLITLDFKSFAGLLLCYLP